MPRIYDIVGSLLFMFIGFYVVIGGWKLGSGTWRMPGPGFTAILWGILLILLSGLSLAATIGKRIATGASYSFFPKRDSYKRVLLIIFSLAVFAVLLNKLGFIFSALILMIFLFRAIEPQRWLLTFLMASLTIIFSVCIFQFWLKVQFPEGPVNIYWIKKVITGWIH